jgi:metacaspase-1
MPKYLLILLFCSFQALGVNKYALLIGIGAYPKEVGATKLNGDNDLDLMQVTLTGLGFDKNNIRSLKNSDATKSNILANFKQLTTILQKGDILVIHYSGHGAKVIDDDIDTKKGIKEEVDGYDEAILCYDGEFLIDDEIYEILKQIQRKIGEYGQVITFFDCCYSGTMSRDLQEFKNQENFEEIRNTNSGDEAKLFFFSSVSASGKSEQSTDGAGILTEALSKLLKLPLKTYNDLFAKLQEEISKKSNTSTNFLLLPTFEGNGNAIIFGQGELQQDFFYEIQKISTDSTSITINGGKLAGVFEKSEVSIYPIGTHLIKENQATYKGVVTMSENFSSKINFTQKLKLANLKSYWVFITKPAFDDYRLSIAVDKKDSIGLAALFKNYSLLKLTTIIKGSEFSLKTDEKQSVLLDNKQLKEVTSDASLDNVLTVAQQFARASILKKLESVNNSDYQIQIELIPVSKNNVDLRDSLSKSLYIKANTPTFDTTMRVLLKVINIGEKPCFFSVLNISSSGQIQAVLPSDESQKYDLFLPKKGVAFLSDEILGFTSPFGDEILIGFASKKPINLFPILNNTWTQARGDDSPLNALLNDVYSGTRSPQEADIKKSEGSIFKYYYRIIPNTK